MFLGETLDETRIPYLVGGVEGGPSAAAVPAVLLLAEVRDQCDGDAYVHSSRTLKDAASASCEQEQYSCRQRRAQDSEESSVLHRGPLVPLLRCCVMS